MNIPVFLPRPPSSLPPNSPFSVDELAYKPFTKVADKNEPMYLNSLAIGDVKISLTSDEDFFFLNTL